MFYNEKPLYVSVHEAIEQITEEKIPMIPDTDEQDDETSLEDLGIYDDDVEQFTEAIAAIFGFEVDLEESEIGAGASVYNVTNYVEENL